MWSYHDGKNGIPGWLPPMRSSPILLRDGSDDVITHHILSGRSLNNSKRAIFVPRGHYSVFLFISSTFPLFHRTDRKTFLRSPPSKGKAFRKGENSFSSVHISDLGKSVQDVDGFNSARQRYSIGSAVDSMTLCPALSRRAKRFGRLHPLRSPSPGKIQPLPADRKTPP